MANCTNVGFAGSFTFNGQNILPSGKVCVLSGYVQSAATQTATVTNSTGVVVAQIQGVGGTTGTPVVMTSPSGKTNAFTADGNSYTITFTSTSGQTTRGLSASDNIAIGSTTYAASWTFITEDIPNGGDCDFNDATVSLTWNLLKG
ncbi:MAG TPA: hypothetical protein VF173_03715 [Thermoanaerobaculia bacterium]|nr:hypothetical protein [Thermoanaerobaculia bacterium]